MNLLLSTTAWRRYDPQAIRTDNRRADDVTHYLSNTLLPTPVVQSLKEFFRYVGVVAQ